MREDELLKFTPKTHTESLETGPLKNLVKDCRQEARVLRQKGFW